MEKGIVHAGNDHEANPIGNGAVGKRPERAGIPAEHRAVIGTIDEPIVVPCSRLETGHLLLLRRNRFRVQPAHYRF